MLKPLRLRLVIVGISLAGIAVISLCLLHYNTQAMQVTNIVQAHFRVFILWRYELFGLLLIFWPKFIQWLGQCRQWDIEIIQLLVKKRLHIGVLFILIELFIVQNGLNRILFFL